MGVLLFFLPTYPKSGQSWLQAVPDPGSAPGHFLLKVNSSFPLLPNSCLQEILLLLGFFSLRIVVSVTRTLNETEPLIMLLIPAVLLRCLPEKKPTDPFIKLWEKCVYFLTIQITALSKQRLLLEPVHYCSSQRSKILVMNSVFHLKDMRSSTRGVNMYLRSQEEQWRPESESQWYLEVYALCLSPMNPVVIE